MSQEEVKDLFNQFDEISKDDHVHHKARQQAKENVWLLDLVLNGYN